MHTRRLLLAGVDLTYYARETPSPTEQANAQRSYQIEPMTSSDLSEQQKIADAFYAAKLLPKRIDAQDVGTWQPGKP